MFISLFIFLELFLRIILFDLIVSTINWLDYFCFCRHWRDHLLNDQNLIRFFSSFFQQFSIFFFFSLSLSLSLDKSNNKPTLLITTKHLIEISWTSKTYNLQPHKFHVFMFWPFCCYCWCCCWIFIFSFFHLWAYHK